MPTKPRKTATKGWSVRAGWTDINGNQQKCTKSGFSSARDAMEWAIAFESLNSKKAEDAYSLTTELYLERWLKARKEAKDISVNTLRNYKNDVEKMLPHIGQIPLQQLRLDQVQNMIYKLEGSPRTVQMVRNTLSTALNYGCRNGFIDKNVASLAKVPKQVRFKYSTLTPEEAIKQLDLMREKKSILYMPVALALFAGLRRGEALGLRWADVDLDKKTIHVCNQYTVEDGKPVHKSVLKTEGSEQFLPIPDILVDILRNQKEEQIRLRCIETYVCSKFGRLPSLYSFDQRLNAFQINNGFPKRRFHDYRHTFATRLLDAGVDIRTISEMLRHKTPTLAMRTYIHPSDKIKTEAAEKLNNVFQAKTSKPSMRLRRKMS